MSRPTAPRHLQIAKPCSKKWDELVGDERRRYCGACEKHVYNLEVMEPDELVALVEETEGRFCGRLYRRPKELTVLTEDCPVGVRSARRRRVGGAAIAVAAAAGAAVAATVDADPARTVTMGEMEPVELHPALGKVRLNTPDPDPEPEEEVDEVGEVTEEFLYEKELLGDVVVEPEEDLDDDVGKLIQPDPRTVSAPAVDTAALD